MSADGVRAPPPSRLTPRTVEVSFDQASPSTVQFRIPAVSLRRPLRAPEVGNSPPAHTSGSPASGQAAGGVVQSSKVVGELRRPYREARFVGRSDDRTRI